MPDGWTLLLLFVVICASAFAGAFMAFRVILHILDKWMG